MNKVNLSNSCGEEAVSAADNTKDLDSARAILAKSGLKRNGSITQAFERIGKEKMTYSHRQHRRRICRSDNGFHGSVTVDSG